jgi:hypothetical protein
MRRSLVGELVWAKPPDPAWAHLPKDQRGHRSTGKYGEPVQVKLPAILSPDEFDRLQAALQASTTPTPTKAVPYLLSGRGHQHLLMPCDGAAHGVWDRSGNRRRQYRCTNRRPELPPAEQCGCLRLDAEQVEWWVRVSVLGLLSNPDLMDEAMLAALEPEPATHPRVSTADLGVQIGRLERTLAGAYEGGLRAGLDPQALAVATGNITADLAVLRGRRERVVLAQAEAADRQARLSELPRIAEEAWAWDDQQWRQFIARWGIHVHVVRWLTGAEMALRSPIGDPPPMPFVARIEGLYPRDAENQAPRCWTCSRPPTPAITGS